MDKEKKADEKIITSNDLLNQVNRERAASGEYKIKAINSVGGTTTNNYSKHDKSWNSVPGFFKKAFKHEDEKPAADASEDKAEDKE